MKLKHVLGFGALLLVLALPGKASAVGETVPPAEPPGSSDSTVEVPTPAGEPPAEVSRAPKLTRKQARRGIRHTLRLDALRFVNWRQGFGRFIKCHRTAKRRMRCKAGWKLGKKRRFFRVKARARVRLTKHGRVRTNLFIMFRGQLIGIATVTDAR